MLWWEMESWPTKKWGVGEKRLRTPDLEQIENLYAELTSSLLAATYSAFKTTGKKKAGKFNIPGWNSVVKSKHEIAKAAF